MSNDNKLIVASTAVFIIFLLYGYLSEGTYQDDDVSHFLIAKISWKYPEAFFSIWGRPAFTVPYSFPAQFGFTAARIFTSVLAALACFFAGKVAKENGIERFYLTPIFVGMQPIYLGLSFAFLTETIFSLYLILAIYFLKTERYSLSAIAISLLPLARHEGLVFVVLWSIIYLKKKAMVPLLILVAPMALWNLGSYFFTDSMPADIFFSASSEAPLFKIEKSLLHYVFFFPAATGLILVFLFEVGFLKSVLKKKLDILHVSFAVYFVVQTLLYAWSLGGSGGYLRFLAGISPVCGIFALVGFNYFLERRQWRQEAVFVPAIVITFLGLIYGLQKFYEPLVDKRLSLIAQGETKHLYLSANMNLGLVSFVACLLLLLVLLKFYSNYRLRTFLQYVLIVVIFVNGSLLAVRPYKLNATATTMKEVAQWMNETNMSARNVLFSPHPWLFHFLENGYERRVLSCVEQYKRYQKECLVYENLVNAPDGTIVVWNRKYGDKMAMNYLEKNEEFRLLKTFSISTKGAPDVYVFEKV
jgi:hypothetical protein